MSPVTDTRGRARVFWARVGKLALAALGHAAASHPADGTAAGPLIGCAAVPARYIVRASTEFSAAHVLRGYQGACERIHGHNFKITIEVEATALDDVGMAVDFTLLERALAETAQQLDHRLLNETPAFEQVNPTAENIGAFFWRQLAPAVRASGAFGSPHGLQLRCVTVAENDRTSVSYSEPDA